MLIEIKAEITPQQLADQMATFMENKQEWCFGLEPISKYYKHWYADSEYFRGEFGVRITYDDPEFVRSEVNQEFSRQAARTLTEIDFFKGLTTMAEKYPTHFADLVSDNGDANTADLLMQCVLFGEEVYS